jgi:hypothetical protein
MAKTIAELAKKLKTPRQVQRFIHTLEYNKGNTMRSAQSALRLGSVHCMEAAFVAAAILEHHGYPPLVVSLESIDRLDHVLFVFQKNGKWGAIGRSRERGLAGRAPVFRSIRDLAWSYYDPYIDDTGKIKSYQLAHLDETDSDWRFGKTNQFKAEKYLLKIPHKRLRSSRKRFLRLKAAWFKRGPMAMQKFWW